MASRNVKPPTMSRSTAPMLTLRIFPSIIANYLTNPATLRDVAACCRTAIFTVYTVHDAIKGLSQRHTKVEPPLVCLRSSLDPATYDLSTRTWIDGFETQEVTAHSYP